MKEDEQKKKIIVALGVLATMSHSLGLVYEGIDLPLEKLVEVMKPEARAYAQDDSLIKKFIAERGIKEFYDYLSFLKNKIGLHKEVSLIVERTIKLIPERERNSFKLI